MLSNKIIFISALDWGLGHATRCVPIIRNLQKNNTVIIGITPLTKLIFEDEFPHLKKINLPAYNITYSKTIPIWLKLLFNWYRILKVIKQERKQLEKIISQNKIDVVISDNRFGLYSKKIHSIFITHQLFLKTPFANSFIQNINKKYILNFNEVWIPDNENETLSLSGSLSHGSHFHSNIKYIGALSRLTKSNYSEPFYDYLFLISGPEPQQTVLINLVLQKAKQNSNLKFAMVCTNNLTYKTENITVINLPNSSQLSETISKSKKIICRSGYSTIMDLYELQINFRNVTFVPTPSQTEQEYLANYLMNKFGSVVISQKLFSQKKLQ